MDLDIVCIDDKEENLKLNIRKIVGPPTARKYERQYSIQAPGNSPSLMRTTSLNDNIISDEEFIHFIIVKIPEKVFIDSLDIYETTITKIDLYFDGEYDEADVDIKMLDGPEKDYAHSF